MQTVSQCRVGNGSNNSYKTCYAIKRYPYNNGRLLAVTPSIISEDLNPDTGIIKYICPHILGSEASRKVQLQAKIKFIYINKDRFTPAIFPSNSDETDILDSLITITNLSIDGDIGSGTKSAIKELIRAHFYCDNSDKEDEERIIANDSTKISDAKILAFVNRYVDSVEISSDDDHYVIRDFYSWFTDESQVNFSNMCWNNSQ